MPGQIVNGGLIDFQDNFHRGMNEYVQAPQMPGYPANGMGYMPHPSMTFPQATPGQLPCISGPPSFIHVNGVTYKPVDDGHAKPADATIRVDPVSEPTPRVLTDDDIDQRVKARVEMWASTQRKPVSSNRGAGNRAAMSDEERIASRVNSLNEGMRGRFRSPM